MKWKSQSLPAHALALALAVGAALLGLPVVTLYRRIEKPQLLQTEARRRVYEHVARRPGVTATQIAADEGFDRKTVAHHARLLREHALLEEERDGRAVRYFLPGTRVRHAPAHGVAAHLLRLALRRPGASQTEAATTLGVSRATVQWHHRRLAERGLLERSRLAVPLDERARLREALGEENPWPVT